MADLLNTSISGLLAFQRALDTTSHNITNANTVGYSRQLPEFMTRNAQQSGNGWLGNGVDVVTIKRAYDDFLSNQARSSSSSFNQANTYATQAERISNLFGDSSTGLSSSLQKFVNAMQAVADTPASIPARQTLLSQAQTLVDRLKGYDDSPQELRRAGERVARDRSGYGELDRPQHRATEPADHERLRPDGQPPNDLMDQRDRLIDDLATHINVNVVEQGDNSVNVFIGNGQPLVVGQTAATVVTSADPYDPTRNIVAVRSAHGEIDITRSLSGGALGGVLDFRTQMLEPARNTLGRMSIAIAQVVNEQHGAGVDLNGDPGADFFAVGGVGVRSNSNNSGTSGAVVTRLDGAAGALTTGDYLMTYAAGAWTLRRTDTGATVPMTGAGSAGNPFVADGLSIEVTVRRWMAIGC